MSDAYVPVLGDSIDPMELQIPKAREIVHILQSGVLNWVGFVECRRVRADRNIQPTQTSDIEIVVLEVEVELPQRPVNDIRRFERIAVSFSDSDRTHPEVLALREDFPRVPHLNLRDFEIPRSLCLYDQAYSEIKLTWTASSFIERIRSWLAGTAAGTLHGADQQLEPLLVGDHSALVLPTELLTDAEGDTPKPLAVYPVDGGTGAITLVATRLEQTDSRRPTLRWIATVVVGTPQPHGVMTRHPLNLYELNEFLERAGVNLLTTLRDRVGEWPREKVFLDHGLVIVVVLPKTREAAGPVESTDLWAFLFIRPFTREAGWQGEEDQSLHAKESDKILTIGQVGELIGVWSLREGVPGIIIGGDAAKQGKEVGVLTLNPVMGLSREAAARLNHLAFRENTKITAVGVGALGSQVFLNLIRCGYGEWDVIDKDCLLPHNLARHGLLGVVPGWAKATCLAAAANETIDGEPIARAIVTDVMAAAEATDRVNESLSRADVILDCSASISVARYLSHDVESDARRASLFLNPSGTDLVLLVEDAGRHTPLALLEMQYYRSITEEASLGNHLMPSDGRIRYGHSCRDVSNTIPHEYVSLHAAIGSRALRRALANSSPLIAVWLINDNDSGVRPLNVHTSAALEVRVRTWTVWSDLHLLEKVRLARQARLPKETGGILVGSFDTYRRIVYIVDTVPSPVDSIEERTGYVRGGAGLDEATKRIERMTGGNLRYAGEWHSHPPAHNVEASCEDRKLFKWLAEKMSTEGLPPVMLIVGDEGQASWYVETLPEPSGAAAR
jgi:Prokaryotic E2 family A/ThiF family/Prokaryotic homologs of the JAB domain